ncbi:MAG: DNA polymerase Y family protein, partial [Planctomycetes bacterium]|nr:DNA polymerase Y family protein [Planctomycetota bacterium]
MTAPANDRSRTACVDVPALPLQLVLRAHPEWRADPVVVVENDRPEARILWANRAARDARIQRGIRFRAAEALVRRLHAAVLPQSEVEHACADLLRLLLRFSPGVEPVPAEPGVFFVDPNGLHELFTGLEPWAKALHDALVAQGFVASVVAGFARFPTFAIARARTGWILLASPEDERRRAAAVPFRVLDAPPKLREQMEELGIRTLGDFLRLPAHELGRRFGKAAEALHTRATASWTPLAPVLPAEPVRFVHEFEMPDADLERFLALFADGLHTATAQVAARREAITAVCIRMRLEHAPPRDERLAPAAPTLDVRQLLELVRLRLGQAPLGGPLERFDVYLEIKTFRRRQLEVLPRVRRRYLAASGSAIARLTASF